MNSEFHLEITDLSLIRGFRRVVLGFNAKIQPGHAYWLSGANGAGKTTLLRALAGFLRPAAGKIEWHGIDQDQILFLPARAPVKAALTVREQWELWQKNFQCTCMIPHELGLFNHLDQHISKLSAGQQRRLALALLTLTNRRIWILDEAFNHLDDTGNAWLKQQVSQHIAKNNMVIIAAPIVPPDQTFSVIEL